MTVGFHSPLPPARTGVADYSQALLRHLRKRLKIELAASRSDVNLYHLGNNQLHRCIYRRALASPGVAVLHDALLHHFFLGALDRDDYVREFTFNYGEWNRSVAEDFWRGRAGSAADASYFCYPMIRRVCEASRLVIVHNPAAAATVKEHATSARVVEIPMLFDRPSDVPRTQIEETRNRLGVAPGVLLAAIFGHLRESKRLMPVLRVFRRIPRGKIVLLLAGEMGSSDLERAMGAEVRGLDVRRVPYTPPEQFWRLAQATDFCLNLRYPAAGETSAIGIAFMGLGKPVVFTEGAEIARYPETSCIRIAPGCAEEEHLRHVLNWIAAFPYDARRVGDRAARYIAEHHSPDRVADLYCQALLQARP